VRQAKALVDRLRAEGLSPAALNVVVNRYQRNLWGRGVKLSTAEEALGHKVDFVIADDHKLVSTALDHGQTLREAKPGSRIEKQVRDMVRHLLLRFEPEPVAEAPRQAHRPAQRR
jgi:Flp pilus assembly CpaE family ATPase